MGETSPVSAIEAIEKAMEGVTHGDWYLAGKLTIRHASPVGGTHGWIGKVNWQNGEANAAYITACKPSRMREVLSLARKAEALQRENAELREALKPFADVADLVDSETEGVADSDEFQMHFHDYLMASWKLSMFRRARALLGGYENAGN